MAELKKKLAYINTLARENEADGYGDEFERRSNIERLLYGALNKGTITKAQHTELWLEYC